MRNPIQEPLRTITDEPEADELDIGGTFLSLPFMTIFLVCNLNIFRRFQFLCFCSDAIPFNLCG